jgi:hypothetical protein
MSGAGFSLESLSKLFACKAVGHADSGFAELAPERKPDFHAQRTELCAWHAGNSGDMTGICPLIPDRVPGIEIRLEVKVMGHLALNDWLLIGIVVVLALRKTLKALGWNRGAMIADELEGALREARDFIVQARAGDALQIDRAAEVVSSKISGVSAGDVKPVIAALVAGAADSRYGVNFALDSQGNVTVDTSGIAAKLARKTGKWLKKVF